MSLVFPAEVLTSPPGQVVRFALQGPPLPRRSATLATEAFRAAALSALHATTGDRDSFLLSGHDAQGSADRGHRHAYYLPLFSGEDQLTGLLVVSPQAKFNVQEMDALKAVRAIRWGGPATRTAVELLDADDHSAFQVATRWVSLTPYAPLRRFWGTSGKRHLSPERQLSAELATIFPNLAKVKVKTIGSTRARVRLARNAPERPEWQLAFNLEIQFPQPICGPVVLGHSSHFGLGLFVPAESR
jgi:CRISPR-associated protein Csb2